MKIAVQYPSYIFHDPDRNFNGYNTEFAIRHASYVYLPHRKGWLTQTFTRFDNEVRRFQNKLKMLSGSKKPPRVLVSAAELNAKADVLVVFNGEPYQPNNCPPSSFSGLKIVHLLDYVFYPEETLMALESSRVDYVLGYTKHDQYCPFFQHYYETYKNRVISVPFGYAQRFEHNISFETRIPKVLGIGSVNPVNDPYVENKQQLVRYIQFYAGLKWTHAWRHQLRQAKETLSDIFESHYPFPPATKDPGYDPVELHKRYLLFANDEGLMNFPPARTYEGCASGAIMVAADSPIYRDLGFVDQHNCILHHRHDVDDFRKKVATALSDTAHLKMLSDASKKLVRHRYSHANVADQLQNDIKGIFKK